MSSPLLSRPQKLQKRNWTNQEGILGVRRSLTLRGKNFGRNQNFLTIGQWATNCRFFDEICLAGLLTPHSICPAKSFEAIEFFSKKYKFDILFWFWMKSFRIYGRSFRQECQKQNPCDQKKKFINFFLKEGTTLYFVMVFLRKRWFARRLQVRQ